MTNSLTPAVLESLGLETYVLLTTFRRTGERVSTPVWIGRDGDALLVTTGGASGKVKRLAHNASVELTPCDRVGTVADGALTTIAHATVQRDEVSIARLVAVIEKKYGEAYRQIRAAAVNRPAGAESVALRIVAV
jgi:PPOX class probable F420-dependent enzyme